jgi:exonuclease III
MAQTRKTIQELIAQEQKKSERAKARIAELKGQERSDERKKDSHRKIVVGAAVIAHIKIDPQFRKELREALNKAVTDPKHRAVIPDLLDEEAFHAAMRAAAKKAEAEANDGQETAEAANAPAGTATRPQQGKRAADSKGAAPT